MSYRVDGCIVVLICIRHGLPSNFRSLSAYSSEKNNNYFRKQTNKCKKEKCNSLTASVGINEDIDKKKGRHDCWISDFGQGKNTTVPSFLFSRPKLFTDNMVYNEEKFVRKMQQ